MFSRQNVAQVVAEFFGSAVLATVTLAVMRSQVGVPYFIAMAVGLTFAVLVLVLSAVSGAHINPIVTLGLWTVRKIGTLKALLYLAAQIVGALAAWSLYTYLINDDLTNIAGSDFDWRILIAEAVGAMVFMFGVAAATYQRHEGGRLATTLGASYVLGILIASVVSNGLINPAVALSVQSWSVAYVAGPVVGAILGTNLYAMLFAEPGQLVISRSRVSVTESKPAVKRTKAKTRRRK